MGYHIPSTTVHPSNRFSIHGLWPERLDGSWPSCCDSDYPFRIQKITDLLPELAHDWFSYTSGIKYQCSWDPVTADARATAPWTKRMVARVHQLLGSTWYPKIPGRALLGDAHDDHDDDLHHHEEHGDRHRHGHHNNKRRDAPHHHHGHDDLHAYDHKHHDNDGKANRDSPNYQFWRHEWEKHGTCSLDVLENEKEYFEAVLRLHRTFSIDVRWVHIDQAPPYINTIPPQMYLHDADIVPATDRYLYKDVVKAIATGAGAEPFISCKDGEVNEVRSHSMYES